MVNEEMSRVDEMGLRTRKVILPSTAPKFVVCCNPLGLLCPSGRQEAYARCWVDASVASVSGCQEQRIGFIAGTRVYTSER